MNRKTNSRSKAFAIVVAMMMMALIAGPIVGGATTEEELVTKFHKCAEPSAMVSSVKSVESFVASDESFKFTLKEPLPLSIKIWIPRRPNFKMSILECGSGLNPESNYNTNSGRSVVERLLRRGHIVVGMIPRENAYDKDSQNQEVLRYLDLNSRANDLERVVRLLGFFPHIEVVGHSAGAMPAILCASRIGDSVPGFTGVRIIDMDILYEPGTEEWQNAWTCYNASKEMLEQGVCIAEDLTTQKELAYAAKIYPDADSGVPRPEPLLGNFTCEGLFYSSLIYTGSFPGVLTPLTGLPGGWAYEQGFFAGEYNFSSDPANDTYSLTHTDIATVYELLEKTDSGVSPMAMHRDIYAMQCGQYPIDLSNIKVDVSLTGAELGMGENDYAVSQLRANGVNVKYEVVPSFAHADLTHSRKVGRILRI